MKPFHWILLLALGFNAGLLFGVRPTHDERAGQQTLQLNGQFLDGDLVLRNGRGLVSSWFRKMSQKEQRYTHAGLLRIHNGKAWVVHCYQDSPEPGLVEEPLEKFVNNHICSDYAIYRYDLNDAQRATLMSEIDVDIKKGVGFDDSFELNNDARQYCSEWVYHRLETASKDAEYIPLTHVKNFAYVAPDNLYLNQHASCCWRQHY